LGVGVYLGAVLLNFAYLYPVLAAQTLPYEQWLARMWLSSWI
jgi:dolichyl-phosphate-mannose--protein O-mannosyl transferase